MQLLTDGVCIKLLTPGSLRVSLMLSAAAELMAGDAKLKRIRVNTFLGVQILFVGTERIECRIFLFRRSGERDI
jgi:hypothetical protein